MSKFKVEVIGGKPPKPPEGLINRLRRVLHKAKLAALHRPKTAMLTGFVGFVLLVGTPHVGWDYQCRHAVWGRALMAEAGADIRRHWTPDAANFFGRCLTRYLDAVHAQIAPAAPEDTVAAFAAQKKAGKAETLEKLFAGDDGARQVWRIDATADERIATWLPDELATMQGDA